MDTLHRSGVRKSVPLSARDQHDLELMRTSAIHRRTLADIADTEVGEDASEAALLHAVLEAGIRAVEKQVEAAGYDQIAGELDTERRKASARRRRPSWADE